MSEENKNNQTLNEEIRDFNKEVLGKLDSPLVVHKKSDASYEDTTDQYEMNSTHNGEERPTLERHRFRKEKKKSKAPIVLLLLIAILASVFAGLYYSGKITFNKETTTEKSTSTTESTTLDIASKYQGTIVVKGTYIFVNGEEVNGIEGLQDDVKYEDASPNTFELIVEDENAQFFNNEVLPLLESLGFFTSETKVTHLDKTGLMAAAETTTLPPSTTQPTTTVPPSTQPSTQSVSG